MNPKIEKLRTERSKHVKKVEALNARIEELDQQIMELENLDIIGLVRGCSLTPEKLAELLYAANLNAAPERAEKEAAEYVEG